MTSNLNTLPNLNIQNIIEVLKKRYKNNNIYTYSGYTLISINPYKRLNIYDSNVVQAYKNSLKNFYEIEDVYSDNEIENTTCLTNEDANARPNCAKNSKVTIYDSEKLYHAEKNNANFSGIPGVSHNDSEITCVTSTVNVPQRSAKSIENYGIKGTNNNTKNNNDTATNIDHTIYGLENNTVNTSKEEKIAYINEETYYPADEPHIYSLASSSLHLLSLYHNVTIVISGDSGSGKTMNFNYLINFICDDSMRTKINAINTVLEAFGNAKTELNNNSSRFGKMLNLNIIKSKVVGASIEIYLLEKNRVTSGDTNFHIFYYLLGHKQTTYENDYIKNTDLTPDELRNNKKCYEEVLSCLKILDIDCVDEIENILLGIIELGSLKFLLDGNDTYKLASNIDPICSLLQIESNNIRNFLMYTEIKLPNEILRKNNDYITIIKRRDTLARCLYSSLFKYTVDRINKCINTQHTENTISLLDIYGFEFFEKNGFDQFNINWANEKLQDDFVTRMINDMEKMFMAEGIVASDDRQNSGNDCNEGCEFIKNTIDKDCQIARSYKTERDNALDQRVTDSRDLQNKQKNIFFADIKSESKQTQINSANIESCSQNSHIMPQSQKSDKTKNVESFKIANVKTKLRDQHNTRTALDDIEGKCKLVDLINESSLFRTNDLLIKISNHCPNIQVNKDQFCINHFASTVWYEIADFVEKNNESNLSFDILDSKNTIIKAFRATNSSTVLKAFKASLDSLFVRLAKSKTFYVRCIKPNPKKTNLFDDEFVYKQLLVSGVVESVEISKKYESHYMDFDEFTKRYKDLTYKMIEYENGKVISETGDGVVVKKGKTRVFMSNKGVTELENMRMTYIKTCKDVIRKTLKIIHETEKDKKYGAEIRNFLNIVKEDKLENDGNIKKELSNSEGLTNNCKIQNCGEAENFKIFFGTDNNTQNEVDSMIFDEDTSCSVKLEIDYTVTNDDQSKLEFAFDNKEIEIIGFEDTERKIYSDNLDNTKIGEMKEITLQEFGSKTINDKIKIFNGESSKIEDPERTKKPFASINDIKKVSKKDALGFELDINEDKNSKHTVDEIENDISGNLENIDQNPRVGACIKPRREGPIKNVEWDNHKGNVNFEDATTEKCRNCKILELKYWHQTVELKTKKKMEQEIKGYIAKIEALEIELQKHRKEKPKEKPINSNIKSFKLSLTSPYDVFGCLIEMYIDFCPEPVVFLPQKEITSFAHVIYQVFVILSVKNHTILDSVEMFAGQLRDRYSLFEKDIHKVSFILSNIIELKFIVSGDEKMHNGYLYNTISILDEAIHILYIHLCESCKETILTVIPESILEFQGLKEFPCKENFYTRFFRKKKDMTILINKLYDINHILSYNYLHTTYKRELLNYLFATINAICFNDLIIRSNFLSYNRNLQINNNLNMLEKFCHDIEFDGMSHLVNLREVVKLVNFARAGMPSDKILVNVQLNRAMVRELMSKIKEDLDYVFDDSDECKFVNDAKLKIVVLDDTTEFRFLVGRYVPSECVKSILESI